MRKVITSFLVFVAAFFIFSAAPVSAKVLTNKTGDVTVTKNEVVNDDLFIGAQTAEIDGVVNGDVFVAAQSVKITGTVNGNLHIGGSIIDLSGLVKGNVYVAGQNILITGANIGGSLLVAGATVNVDKDSTIGGSILAGAGNLSIDSQIRRSVYAGTGNLTIGDNTKIGKDLYYAVGKTGNQANISSNAKILGTVKKSVINPSNNNVNIKTAQKQAQGVLSAVKFGASVISFVGAIIVGLIFIKLFNKHFVSALNFAGSSFWKSFGIGFLITIAFIPGIIILIITVVGIPVAGLAVLTILIFSYFAKIVVGAALGTWMSNKFNWKMPTFGAFVLGLLIIYILKLIPVVGFITGLTVLWVGIGALTLHAISETK